MNSIVKILDKFIRDYTLCIDDDLTDMSNNQCIGFCIGDQAGLPVSCGYLFGVSIEGVLLYKGVNVNLSFDLVSPTNYLLVTGVDLI